MCKMLQPLCDVIANSLFALCYSDLCQVKTSNVGGNGYTYFTLMYIFYHNML